MVLHRPRGNVIRTKELFNFFDLIEKFSKKDSSSSVETGPVKFNIKAIEIKEGEFYYKEPITPIAYSIKNVNLKSKGTFWNIDSINGTLSFESGKGKVESDFMINTSTLDYRLNVIAHKLDLNIIEQYLKDLSNYGTVSAIIDANLRVKGNLNDQERINIKGDIAIHDFYLGETDGEDYSSFKLFKIGITELDPEHGKYFFDSVLVEGFYLKYEQYDNLDNFQRMFGDDGAAVLAVNDNPAKFNLILEVAKYVKVIFENFLQSEYKVNNLTVKDGDIKYSDFSINEKFSASLSPLNITADSIDNKKRNVHVNLESGIKPYGALSVSLVMSTASNKDFDLSFKFQKIPLAHFNPYLNKYTSFSMDRGHLELIGNWIVRDDVISSTNHLLAIDPRLTKKNRNKDTKWLPMPLIMTFVKEKGNVVDYEIPISGDLNNPKFHLRDAMVDMLKNSFVKPITTHYRLEVRNTESKIEKAQAFTWAMHQTKLNKPQENFETEIADYLKKNPETTIAITPINYVEKEKEYILFFESKKKYFMSLKPKSDTKMTEGDSLKIEKLSVKDVLFINYLNQSTKDSSLFTTQEKCSRLLGTSYINEKLVELVKRREQAFMATFKTSKVENQLKLMSVKNETPFNGFSYFKISYKGEMPEKIMKAFEKLEDFDGESPREKYRDFRKS